jgi:hypothetical protein
MTILFLQEWIFKGSLFRPGEIQTDVPEDLAQTLIRKGIARSQDPPGPTERKEAQT